MARTSFENSANGITWKPTVDHEGVPRRDADPKKDFVEGHLMKVKENVGKNGSMIYQLNISPYPKIPYTGFGSPDDTVNVWGCNVLDSQMEAFMKSPIGGIGAWCRIEYKGRKVKKAATNKSEKALDKSDLISMYEVIGDDEIPAIKVDGQKAYTPNATNTAPAPKPQAEVKTAAPVQEVPATIDDSDDDGLPF